MPDVPYDPFDPPPPNTPNLYRRRKEAMRQELWLIARVVFYVVLFFMVAWWTEEWLGAAWLVLALESLRYRWKKMLRDQDRSPVRTDNEGTGLERGLRRWFDL